MYSKYIGWQSTAAALLMAAAIAYASPEWLLARGARMSQAPSDALPPLSYVCPMPADAEVLEYEPGRCPKCGMPLRPVRLDVRFACPVHQTFIVADPGRHPYDGRELVPVTVAVTWVCGDQTFLEPGRCENGAARKEVDVQRPHGDHNPKHGGQFFMASDAWHHLEGTYPKPGLFRVYFYNDYSKPLKPVGFSGTVTVLDERDQPVGTPVDLTSGPISNTFEAALPASEPGLPLRLLARVRFKADARPNIFNFTFPSVTKEPVVAVKGPPASEGRKPTRPPTARAAVAEAGSPASASGTAATPLTADGGQTGEADKVTPDTQDAYAQPRASVPPELEAALDEERLPKAIPALLEELRKRTADVETLVQSGDLGQVWLPAMGTKTVALALAAEARRLPSERQLAADAAAARVVAAAWQLDQYGDLGNKLKMDAAYTRLATAVADLAEAYDPR